MAQRGSNNNIKEKIAAVRAIVPNRSNNEIILVLQHYDNCVDKAAQAFMEGNATELLKEWNITGKKNKRKKKVKPKPNVDAKPEPLQPGKTTSNGGELSAASSEKEEINCYHVNGSMNGDESVDSVSEHLETLSMDAQEFEDSESLTPEINGIMGTNIEKSSKDLQRCTVSLARYRAVIKEEIDISIKKLKVAFAEIQNCFMDREVALLGEMDKVKAEALEILDRRQKRAEALKRNTENAVHMSEEQLVELRADIKHFVSERKYDEDLSRCAQFTCDVEELKASIQAFGQVSHPKNSYSTRSRCDSVTLMSVMNSGNTSPQAPPDSTTNATFSKVAKKTQLSSDFSTATANSGNRTFPSNQSVPHGNRRPGYRSPENGITGQTHSGRKDNRNWYRSGPRNNSKTHYNPHPSSQSVNPEKAQVRSTAPSDVATASASLKPSLPSAPAKALPQRRPRSIGSEAAVNS
ncbi:spermatogenesis-associated serine-rich protein 2-like isoform X3 [Narcine bancroftii]|uniref:spermatogenesis-associated serine-rich protein 2-like isoform X3 n=1 Tax=Narcine bancroftii TaxID=1343680 RepID=UPI0038320C46